MNSQMLQFSIKTENLNSFLDYPSFHAHERECEWFFSGNNGGRLELIVDDFTVRDGNSAELGYSIQLRIYNLETHENKF